MDSEQKFRKTLAQKTLITPDRHSDQSFWNKFENEFAPKNTSEKKGIKYLILQWLNMKINLKIFVPATLSILLASYFFIQYQNKELEEIHLASEIIKHEEVLSNLDLLISMDDLEKSEPDLNIFEDQDDDTDES